MRTHEQTKKTHTYRISYIYITITITTSTNAKRNACNRVSQITGEHVETFLCMAEHINDMYNRNQPNACHLSQQLTKNTTNSMMWIKIERAQDTQNTRKKNIQRSIAFSTRLNSCTCHIFLCNQIIIRKKNWLVQCAVYFCVCFFLSCKFELVWFRCLFWMIFPAICMGVRTWPVAYTSACRCLLDYYCNIYRQ